MEATLYWEWLAMQLEAEGIAARVAHAFHVKLIWQTGSTTDPIDARKLGELLRVNLLPTIWCPTAPRDSTDSCCAGGIWTTRIAGRSEAQLVEVLHDCLLATASSAGLGQPGPARLF